MKPQIAFRDALENEHLFGPMLAGASWLAPKTAWLAARGEELNDQELEIFDAISGGRTYVPGIIPDEVVVIAGRRSAKSRMSAIKASFLASCVDYSDVLAPGEHAVIPIMSASSN